MANPPRGTIRSSTGPVDAGRDDAARVREATDIVQVVAEHVALRPKGREFVGLCPFHDDKNPSMYVVPNKQIFHCFVCGAGGDVFTFVRRHLGLEFREALELLAQRAGIELTPWRTEGRSASDGPSRGELCEANMHAQRFFRALLDHDEHGRLGRDTIHRRGISSEMVEAFGLGVSPDRWDGLLLKAQQIGLDQRTVVAAGLAKPRDDGSAYDTFRNRLMFPIHDASGRVIAFGARKLRDEDEPKYLNSPESAVFDKSSSVYGLKQASAGIRKENTAIIVEGYTDVIACHQAGLTNAVASLGTALTSGHARLLRRLCDRIVLVFDGDEAGHRAADRAVEVLFTESIDVGVVTLDRVADGKDPDELLKQDGGVERLREAVDGARDLLAYRYDRLASQWRGAGPAAMDKAVREELATLARLGLSRVPRARRELIVRRLCEITGLSPRALSEAIPSGRSAGRRADPPAEQAEADTPRAIATGAAETALGCVLVEPKLLKDAESGGHAAIAGNAYGDEVVQEIARVVAALHERTAEWTFDQVLAELPESEAVSAAVALHERVRSLTDDDGDRLRATWTDCVRQLRSKIDSPAVPVTEDGPAAAEAVARRIERERDARSAIGGSRARIPGLGRRGPTQ